MTQADQVFLGAPPVPEGAEIVCIGVSLGEEPEAWRRAALPFTTDAEQRQAQRFLHSIDGVRHLVGRGLARWVMRGIVGNVVGDFTIMPQGKPVCAGAGADFSISHSGNLVWVAFAGRGHVGIDVEQCRESRDLLRLASMLHPTEYAALQQCSPAELAPAFYRCWVRKEAVLKACGTGLSLPLDRFRVFTDGRARGWLESMDARAVSDWFTEDIPVLAGYHCGVAADFSASELRVVRVGC